MKSKTTLLILALAALLVIAALWAFVAWDSGELNDVDQGGEEEPAANDKLKVFYPLPHGLVTSPLEVRGEARGNWYFEATFPLVLEDADGQVLVQSYATAQGEWMTPDFVSFTGSLVFSRPNTDTGTLVLKKDNPSGLPQYDDQLRVPVKFR